MTKKKLTQKEQRTAWIKQAKKRLPSSRLVMCNMCFSPRNTLTVKPHLESIWKQDEIEIVEKGVKIACKGCKNIRFLSLSSISLGFFDTEYDEYDMFTLLKDDRFNALIGIGEKTDRTITFKAGEIVVK